MVLILVLSQHPQPNLKLEISSTPYFKNQKRTAHLFATTFFFCLPLCQIVIGGQICINSHKKPTFNENGLILEFWNVCGLLSFIYERMPVFCKSLAYKNSHLEGLVILQIAQSLDKTGHLIIIVSVQEKF